MQTLPHVSTCLESTVVDLSTISVFITNLGKYNEGELVDEWLGLAWLCQQRLNMLLNVLSILVLMAFNMKSSFLTDYKS